MASRIRSALSALVVSGLLAGGILGLMQCSLHSGEAALSGSWRWVQSVGGFAGWTLTPATEGHTQRLELGSASEFAFFRNDSLVAQGTFSIESEEDAQIIRYETDSSWWFLADGQRISRRGRDTLILRDRCADCYTHTFVRK